MDPNSTTQRLVEAYVFRTFGKTISQERGVNREWIMLVRDYGDEYLGIADSWEGALNSLINDFKRKGHDPLGTTEEE